MQKISDALMRARQELELGSGVTRLSDRTGRHVEAAPLASPEAIMYSRTRKVQVSFDVLRARRVVSAFLLGPYVDAYKILCTQVLRKMRAKELQELSVTSPGRNEVKTLTAINLDSCLASEVDQTVLLVAEEGVTHSDRLRETAELLASTNVLGTVLNKSRRVDFDGRTEAAIVAPEKPRRRWPWRR